MAGILPANISPHGIFTRRAIFRRAIDRLDYFGGEMTGPPVNFNALRYYDLLNWQVDITEPPILKSVTEENLRLFVEQKGRGELDVIRLPCHTQVVERAVKAVTEASATLCNKIEREGFIKAQVISRK